MHMHVDKVVDIYFWLVTAYSFYLFRMYVYVCVCVCVFVSGSINICKRIKGDHE